MRETLQGTNGSFTDTSGPARGPVGWIAYWAIRKVQHDASNRDGCVCFAYPRGESWSTVANNLPPIYSVRFG